MHTREFSRAFSRVLAAGLAAAALFGGLEWLLFRAQLGDRDQAALALVQTDLIARFDAADRTLTARAAPLLLDLDLVKRARLDPPATRELFVNVESQLRDEERGSGGISI